MNNFIIYLFDIAASFALFGGNSTEINSFLLDNFHQRGGTFTTTQMAFVKIINCTLINQTSFNSGTMNIYFIFKKIIK